MFKPKTENLDNEVGLPIKQYVQNAIRSEVMFAVHLSVDLLKSVHKFPSKYGQYFHYEMLKDRVSVEF